MTFETNKETNKEILDDLLNKDSDINPIDFKTITNKPIKQMAEIQAMGVIAYEIMNLSLAERKRVLNWINDFFDQKPL